MNLEDILTVGKKDFDKVFIKYFWVQTIDIQHHFFDEIRSMPDFYNDKISIKKIVLRKANNYWDLIDTLFSLITKYVWKPSIKVAKRQFMRPKYKKRLTINDFSKVTNKREVWEFLLYFLTESILEHPMIISKMKCKTNPNMPIFWSDGVYIWIENWNLKFYFGEAKICSSLQNAKKESKESFWTTLQPEQILNNDINLLCNNLWNLRSDDPVLINQINQILNPFNEEEIDITLFNYDIICLLWYECDVYKSNKNKIYSKEYLDKVIFDIKYLFRYYKDISGLENKKINFFLLPLYDHKQLIVDFLNQIS